MQQLRNLRSFVKFQVQAIVFAFLVSSRRKTRGHEPAGIANCDRHPNGDFWTRILAGLIYVWGMLRKLEYQPCIPTRGTEVPSGPDWLHEIKHDGYRLI